MTEKKKSSNADALGSIWSTHANIVRAFVEQHPLFGSLCDEVAYILNKRLTANGIQVAAVTARAKSINSFCEKIVRKSYKDPLTEITDLAGVRIVYLYKNDKAKIEKVIESEFEIAEKTDKTDEQESDQFGYGALHYLARLGHGSSGARYDDLKPLMCEIQVRTVLQDAWAIIAHHLSYKHESEVPKTLRRKLNSLSGLFETADEQFYRLRDEREAYVAKVMEKVSNKYQFSQRELDFDILSEYLQTRYSDRDPVQPDQISELLEELRKAGYKTLAHVDTALNKSEKAFIAYEKKYPPSDEGENYKHFGFNPVGCTRVSLCLLDKSYRNITEDEDHLGRYAQFEGLIEK